MKKRNLLNLFFLVAAIMLSQGLKAQGLPVANFTISPNPICTGAVVTINDLSTGNPTAWSYTVTSGFGFPPPTTLTVQNPTVTFNIPGTYSIALIVTNSSGSSTRVTQTITVGLGPNGNVNPATSNVCLGSTAQTSISVVTGGGGGGGVNTYSWSTGSTATQIVVSPSVTTVYTCVITSTSGCSLARTSTVNVVPATVTITSSPANICPGTTSTLHVTGSGPGPWTYTWSNSSNTNSMTSNFPTVVSATIQNASGCKATGTYSLGSSSTLSLTTNSNPQALCTTGGGGGTATVTVTGATNYTWSSGTSTTNAMVVSPSVTTVYTVSGAVGTCTGSATYTLQVSSMPTITINSSTTSICSGGSVTLTANGATNYTWTPGGLFTQSIAPTLTSSTTYTVRGLNPGCAARNNTVAVTVVQSPVISVTSSSLVICAGEGVALSVSGASTYTWSTGSNAQLILSNPVLTTTYSVVGANSSNCINSAAITVTVNECLGINEARGSNLSFVVYPNPNKGSFNISGDYTGELSIYNQLGQIVKVVNKDSASKLITIDGLSDGIYFMLSSDKKLVKKIIVSQN